MCAQVKSLTCLKRRELISLLYLLLFQWTDRMFPACIIVSTTRTADRVVLVLCPGCVQYASFVPRPHPKKGERVLVNLDRFLGVAGSVGARRHGSGQTNLGSDWSTVMGARADDSN